MKNGSISTATIIVPRHVDDQPLRSDMISYRLSIYKPGVIWRGLVPILLEAPKPAARRFLECLFNEPISSISSKTMKHLESKQRNNFMNANDGNHARIEIEDPTDIDCPWRKRTMRLHNSSIKPFDNQPNVIIWLQPPVSIHPDRTFTSMLVRLENALSKLSALTAWWATLGGGYFFCRRISHSLKLARQQKALALILGNVSMARQCTVNEAYNLIYCGRFEDAKLVLKELFVSCGPEDKVTRNQCRSAWLLGKRLKRTARKLDRYRHEVSANNNKKNLDDYQRIRLVY